MKKRILSIALALIMLLSLMPTAFAEEHNSPYDEEYAYINRDALTTNDDLIDMFPNQMIDSSWELIEPNMLPRASVVTGEDYRTWLQADSRWGGLKLGKSSYTVASSGCTVTSVAKLIIQAGLRDTSSFNVATLVNWLNSNGGFTDSGLLYWDKPSKCVSGWKNVGDLVGWNGSGISSAAYTSKILSWINQGYHMTINVSNGGHWVAVDEAKSLATGQVYIMDSLRGKQAADITLSSRYPTFNRIHAYKGGTAPSSVSDTAIHGDTEAHIRDGFFTLKNAESGKFMNVYGGSDANRAAITMWSYDDTTDQQFNVVHKGGGKYKLYAYASSAGTNRVVDVYRNGAAPAAGQVVDLWTPDDDTAQLFYIVPLGDGSYVFELASKNHYVIAPSSASAAGTDGSQLTLQSYTGAKYQKWYFCNNNGVETNPVGSYTIDTYTVSTGGPTLALRSGAGTNTSKLASIPDKTVLNVTQVNGNWGYTNYGGKNGWVCLDYTTYAPKVTAIRIDELPHTLNYDIGDELDTTGLSIIATYSDGTTNTVENNFEVSYDFSSVGTKTITVTYSGQTTTFTVDVTETHSLEAYPAIAPTCTTEGNNLYYYCSDCGKFFSNAACTTEITENSWIIPALGHNFANGVCTVCGYNSNPNPDPDPNPDPNPNPNAMKISAAAVKTTAGKDIHVLVNVEKNPGMNALKLEIGYNAAAMSLTAVNDQSLFASAPTKSKNLTANPYNLIWATAENTTENGALVELVFHVSDTAQPGAETITLTASNAYDENDATVAVVAENAVVNIVRYESGDANGDGQIDVRDATRMLQYFVGWDVTIEEDAADSNADGIVDVRDVTRILQYLAGWDVKLGQ